MSYLKNQKISRFDQVRLLTTRNISYLSAPPGTEISPKGLWSVAAIIDGSRLLCVHNNTTILVPATDVLKVSDYDLDNITKNFGRLSHGER